MEVAVQHHAPAAFTPGKYPVPIVQEAGWASEPIWIGAENLAPTGIRSPELPERRKSLYPLRHPGYILKSVKLFICGDVHNIINLFVNVHQNTTLLIHL
jgi:hypothetical protein